MQDISETVFQTLETSHSPLELTSEAVDGL